MRKVIIPQQNSARALDGIESSSYDREVVFRVSAGETCAVVKAAYYDDDERFFFKELENAIYFALEQKFVCWIVHEDGSLYNRHGVYACQKFESIDC